MNNDRENSEKISMVIDAYERMIFFADTARKEGLLALEEVCGTLDLNDVTQEFLSQQIMLIVDGADPQIVAEFGMNRIAANAFASYDCLIVLMYYKAALGIQSGDNSRILEECMKSLMPGFVKEALIQKSCEGALPEALKEAEDAKKRISSLCRDNEEINEKDHSIINQTAMTLLELSDGAMQRLLRDIDNADLVVAMKGLPGKARARIFDNVSTRLGNLFAEDMEYLGPVRAIDVEEACVTIMGVLMKLESAGEIASLDLSTLKVVIDMYKTAQKQNDEMKEKYRELHEIIERIYRS